MGSRNHQPPVTSDIPEKSRPASRPPAKLWWTLRTGYSSLRIGPSSTRRAYSDSRRAETSLAHTAPNATSAACIPLRIARWIPFSRIEFRKPAASPTISAPST